MIKFTQTSYVLKQHVGPQVTTCGPSSCCQLRVVKLLLLMVNLLRIHQDSYQIWSDISMHLSRDVYLGVTGFICPDTLVIWLLHQIWELPFLLLKLRAAPICYLNPGWLLWLPYKRVPDLILRWTTQLQKLERISFRRFKFVWVFSL